MPTNITGLPQVVAGATVGVEAASPPNITQHKIAPTVTDYYNFNTGDLWLQSVPTNTTPVAGTLRAWMLAAKNVNAQNQKTATWIPFFNGAAGSLVSLTGNNVGVPVFGDANQNVNVVGDGVGITINGVPGTHTLTASLVGGGQAIQALQPAINGVANGAAVTPIAGVIQINNTDLNIVPVAGVPNPNNLNINLANAITLGFKAPTNVLITGLSSTNDNNAATIVLEKIRAGGGSAGAVTNTTFLSAIDSYGFDGTGYTGATAIISAVQPGSTVAANRVAGNLQFWTHPDSVVAASPRFSITSDGTSAFLAPDASAVNATVTVGNSGTNTSLNLNGTYNVPPPGGLQDILVIDSNGFVGTGGAISTGTFTPTLTFSTSTGTITYVSQAGKYTQQGNIVNFICTVAVSGIGTSSGTLRVSNFPFTIATQANLAMDVAMQTSGAITYAAGCTQTWALGLQGTTTFVPACGGSNTNSATFTDASIGGTFTLTLCGFYFTS